MPHYLDLGATSHCSAHCADSIELMPITPHHIKGINGLYIVAIGIGSAKIRCGKGQQLELHDMLYVPQAALHLISVGKLGDVDLT